MKEQNAGIRSIGVLAVLALAIPLESQTRERANAAPKVRICAGGDVMLGTNLDTTWVRSASLRLGSPVRALPDPRTLLSPLRPLVLDADILLLNVEGAIGSGRLSSRKCSRGSGNCYAFRQPPAAASALRDIGGKARVVGNVANNHARDAGESGLLETTRHLRRAGVHVTGDDTTATPVAVGQGDTVAFLGYSTSGGPDPRDLAAVKRHVARAAARYSRVVVTMHMGAEGADAQRTPNMTEIFLGSIDRGNSVAFAHTAVDAGADLVVGHGPHVMRGIEWRDDSLIAYSLGNLVTYGPFTLRDPQNRGAILCASLGPDGRVERAVLRSTVQRPPGLVTRDSSGRAAALVDSLSRLDFPRTRALMVNLASGGRE
ncbi:MAG: CapA family protein [Anaerolineae bacterium]|nr:CapA family protein [Gemmatimonadaceae bacterium]